jgi:iron complex transport system ATP-binding protein
MDKKTYLNIENLTCGYREGFMLKPFNLSLSKGSFGGIIGGNGSGKSTFFKGLTGELKITGGSVRLDGTELSSLSLRERAKRVALVPQFIEKSPITVEEYVLMGRMPYRRAFQFLETKEEQEILENSLELTGIMHLKRCRFTELSGGEQQMTAIACALAQKPQLILLDEPTSHLDITYQSRIMNLLQRLNEEEGLTVLMIIHDLNLAGEYCSHISLVKEGELIIQGDPEEVLRYKNIERAYDTVVVESRNPVSGKPAIFQVSERFSKRYDR